MPTTITGVDEFIRYLKEIRKIAAYTAGGLLCLPLIAGIGGYLPSWPPGILGITSLIEIITLAIIFQACHRASRLKTLKIMSVSALLIILFSAIYMTTNSVFVYTIPATNTKVILGCGISDNTQLILRRLNYPPTTDDCPGDFSTLLKSAQYETDHIWTKLSVGLIKCALATTWLASFSSLSACLGAFICFQRRQKHKIS